MIHNGLEVYTTSMLHTFMSCHRKYQWRYEEQLIGKSRSKAMSFGTTIHEGLAEWYKTKDVSHVCETVERKATQLKLPLTNDEDPKHSLQRARDTMIAYINFYQERDVAVQYVEMPFTLEVRGRAADGMETAPFLYAGTIDGLCEMPMADGTRPLYLLEHKTTSRMDSNYVHSFSMTKQVTAYLWALSQYLDRPVVGAIVNILHLLTHETNFVRHFTTRKPWEFAEWESELQAIVEDIRRCRREGVFYKNTSQCFVMGECAYVTLDKTPPDVLPNFVEGGYEQETPGDLNFLFGEEQNG
jgi:hypothetical protein